MNTPPTRDYSQRLAAPHPHFEVYEDGSSQWRWRLITSNGDSIASGGAYADSQSAVRGAYLVIHTIGSASMGSFDQLSSDIVRVLKDE